MNPVGWNGVRFSVPADWQVGSIGPRYLLFQNEIGPVMEVKWAPIKGAFSRRAYFRRLRMHQDRKLGRALSETPLPEAWAEALSAYETQGFSWSQAGCGGSGAIIFCPDCRNASLIQFHNDPSGQPPDRTDEVMASFRDHPDSERVLYSLFDIKAQVPTEFRLVRHQFEAGRFSLHFADKGRELDLFRWGPASILLKNRSLVEFAESLEGLPPGPPAKVEPDGPEAFQWTSGPPRSLAARLARRLKNRPRHQWVRLWKLDDKNRIHGVWMTSKAAPDPELFNDLCAGYESV